MTHMIKVVELFAGVGGFRVGLTNASNIFDFVWANQWEPDKKKQHAYNCYVHHFGEKGVHVNDDIAKVKYNVPDHDLLVGGFPCQDYSVAATGAKGIEGKKGVLWWEIRDIIQYRKPKYILLENVDRLIKSPTSQKGRDFGIMLKSLDDLGYCVEWKIVNAAEFGHTQRRRRVFIFAYHKKSLIYKKLSNLSITSLLTTKGILAQTFKSKVADSISEKVYNLDEFNNLVDMTLTFKANFKNSGMCKDGKIYTLQMTPLEIKSKPLKEILEIEVVTDKYLIKNNFEKFKYLKGSKRIERLKPNGEIYYYSEGAISFPDNINIASRTILTSESSVNRSTHIIEDIVTKNLRLLTEVECERLNEFEDNWTNTGMPEKFRYYCMGNALVTGVVTKIGQTLIKYLE